MLQANGYVESFNGKLRDECLNGELFLSLAEARYVVDRWRMDYNHRRPHSGINWQTPAAFAGATLAGPPVGATPLPAGPPTNQQQVLSQHLAPRPRRGQRDAFAETAHGDRRQERIWEIPVKLMRESSGPERSRANE